MWPSLPTRLGEIPESSNRSILSIKEGKGTVFDHGLSARLSILDVLLTALSALRRQDEGIFLLSVQPYFSEVRSPKIMQLVLSTFETVPRCDTCHRNFHDVIVSCFFKLHRTTLMLYNSLIIQLQRSFAYV
jgi:hypothetical protein